MYCVPPKVVIRKVGSNLGLYLFIAVCLSLLLVALSANAQDYIGRTDFKLDIIDGEWSLRSTALHRNSQDVFLITGDAYINGYYDAHYGDYALDTVHTPFVSYNNTASVTVVDNSTLFVLTDTDNSRVVFISESEARRLENLRQSVIDAEKEIAKKYGVDTIGTIPDCKPTVGCTTQYIVSPHGPDIYRFVGRFLLVGDVAKEGK